MNSISKKQLIALRSIIKKLFLNRNYLSIYAILMIVLIISLLLVIYFVPQETENTFYVKDVIDGDTIVVNKGLAEYRIRYIGVDTPEMNFGKGEPECFAKEARDFNISKVLNKKVTLKSDKEDRDRFDRLLRYVYIEENQNEVMLNEILISSGYAKVLSIAPNTMYAEKFKNLQDEAKKQNIGIWKECSN